jgi:hypothetical protein
VIGNHQRVIAGPWAAHARVSGQTGLHFIASREAAAIGGNAVVNRPPDPFGDSPGAVTDHDDIAGLHGATPFQGLFFLSMLNEKCQAGIWLAISGNLWFIHTSCNMGMKGTQS